MVVLELALPSEACAKRALLRGVCRRAAAILREDLGYEGAALALEAYAEGLREALYPVDDDEETTVVDTPLAIALGSAPIRQPTTPESERPQYGFRAVVTGRR